MSRPILNLEYVAAALKGAGLSAVLIGDGRVRIDNISYDSNNIPENTLFVCKGFTFKREYLVSAVEKGAVCYIACEDYGLSVPAIITDDTRKALAVVSSLYYGNPALELTLCGITGTKGKTTTTYFLKSILDAWRGKRTAVLSTVEMYTGDKSVEAHLTTPESLELHQRFSEAAANKTDYLTMEVSSQAYKLSRVFGVNFNVGIFLNIGLDHIGPLEHENYEDYFNCKLQLMKNCDTAIINRNSFDFEKIKAVASKNARRVIVFGYGADCDIYVENITKEKPGFSFDVCGDGLRSRFRIRMEGRFNIQNALAAIAAARVFGIPDDKIQDGIGNAQVKGRMNIFENKGVMVIVDYAHNYLSFSELFKSLREDYPGHKLTVVIGCPGGKAYIRRKDIGTLCGEFADYTVLTEEDPGFESVQDICREMATYIEPWNKPYDIIPDRTAAIENTIAAAGPGDIIILAGKGEELYQKENGKYVFYESDLAIAKRCVEALG